MEDQVIERLYEIVNILDKETKQPRSYGTDYSLYPSEVHLIAAIFNHGDANASELSRVLDITNGAITQVADKLSCKGLIERYKVKGNKKEVYFRLTEQGEQVYWEHEEHHNKMNAKVMNYIGALSANETKLIITFLDNIIEGFSLEYHP